MTFKVYCRLHKAGLILKKLVNVIHYTSRLKKKNRMIISRDAKKKKAFDKIKHAFMIKNNFKL